jgi:hypothetical protein
MIRAREQLLKGLSLIVVEKNRDFGVNLLAEGVKAWADFVPQLPHRLLPLLENDVDGLTLRRRERKLPLETLGVTHALARWASGAVEPIPPSCQRYPSHGHTEGKRGEEQTGSENLRSIEHDVLLVTLRLGSSN